MRMDSRLIGLVIGTLATLMMAVAVLGAIFAADTGPFAKLLALTNTGSGNSLEDNFARGIIYTGITLIPLAMFAGALYFFLGMKAGKMGRRRGRRRGRRGGRRGGRRSRGIQVARRQAIPIAVAPRTR